MENNPNKEIIDLIDCGGNLKLKRTKSNNKYTITIKDDSNEIKGIFAYERKNDQKVILTNFDFGIIKILYGLIIV